MRADSWKDIREILRAALKVEPARRGDFLDSAAPSAEIRGEVESLLACEAECADFMSLPITDFSKDFLPPDEFGENVISLIGQKIGIYEVLGELGFGGMGAVYLARRTDEKFEQKVAIKMLRREFNNERIRRYFRREKEIQAKLNHPFIARLLDAGSCADGVPFLVMEYVEGTPVDRFCAAENLSLKERLKLFNKICEAVATAHRNLVVHRDLKPSNILIDEAGEPKLLDFGISKLLDTENGGEKTSVTILEAMTPEYASPEQIRGETVSTATDIYSLGVVLYKILTGKLPFDTKGKTNGKFLKSITDDAPPAPSSVSNSEFQTLNFKLNKDVDKIILKALSKEPERRYATVEQFSTDIWRHLDGLPVSARPATISYRARKFVQRNKISVIAAVFVFLSLIGGIAVALWQARAARAQASLAIESQKKSDDEAEKAKKISDFMSKIIAYGSPHWMSPGYKYKGETKVVEALQELDDRIDIEFAGQPNVQADLHLKFADAYHFHVGDEFIKKKRFHIDRALELQKQIYGEYHEKVAETLFSKWASLPTDDPRQEEVLMEAIQMLRGTNPNNVNLPYMYEGFTNRLAGTFAEIKYEKSNSHQIESNVRVFSGEELKEMYRKAVQPPTDENNFEIAERMLRESLPILRGRYKEDNYSVVAFECSLSYNLAKQNKWTDFDEHFRVCRQIEKVPETSSENHRKRIEVIEKMTVGRNVQN